MPFGLTIRRNPNARSGNRNQNRQLDVLDREAVGVPGNGKVTRVAIPARGDNPNNADAQAFLKRMKEREAARRSR